MSEDTSAVRETVRDEEILYRAVKHGLGRIQWRDGQLRATTDAFLDPNYEVSVERAEIHNFNAAFCQVDATDYVCCLLTQQVRAIEKVVRSDANEQPVEFFVVNVRADPFPKNSPPNPAHALVYTNPQIFPKKDRKLFSRLKESLAQIATWEYNFSPAEPN